MSDEAERKLGMSLDDLVTSSKGGGGRGGGRDRPSRGRGRGAGRSSGRGGGGRSFRDSGFKRERQEPEPIRVACRIFVGNLSYDTSWQSLKDHFRQVGNVVHADIMTDKSNRPRGCGIVEFSSSAEAAAAIEQLDQSEIDGRNVYIREDREDPELKEFLDQEQVEERPRKSGRSGNRRGEDKGTFGGAAAVVTNRLYVNGLSPRTSWQDLKDHFRISGNVVYAEVMTDSSGNSKGCGIIEMETSSEALRAISRLSNSELDGQQIYVREDREDREAPQHRAGPGPRGRGPSSRPTGGSRGASIGCQVVVHGLPYNFSWQDLKDLMRDAGDVARTEIVSHGGKSKGYGTVLFNSSADAAHAIETFDGTTFEGRILSVKHDKFAE